MTFRLATGAVVLAALACFAPAFAQTPYLVADLNTTTPDVYKSSDPQQFQAFGDTLFFSAVTEANGRELWKYTAAGGASMVADIATGSGSSWPGALIDIGGGVFLFTATDLTHGQEWWRTDGTEAGTWLVKDINPGGSAVADSEAGWAARVLDGRLYFAGQDGVHGEEPWVTDGTEAGTQLLLDLDGTAAASNVALIFAFDDRVYLSGDNGLWTTDGTAAGTTRFATTGFAAGAARMGSTLFFTASGTGSTGRELWKTDGTEAGTQMVKEIGAGSLPGVTASSLLTSIGSTFYFTAKTGSAGVQLWKTDGTTAGTELVKVLLPSSNAPPPVAVTWPDGTLYLEVNGWIWRSDGTEAGTVLWRQNAYNFASVFGRLFYVQGNSGSSTLWSSNGVTHSLVLSSQSQLLEVTGTGGKLYFQARDQHGYEPWVSQDGTTATTHRLTNVNPDLPASSSPEGLTADGNLIFFRASDGTAAKKLFRSDGTTGGTFAVTSTDVREWTSRQDQAWFGDSGTGLWKSDGTVGGTVLMKDFVDFPGRPDRLFAGSRFLFFGAGNPRTAWRADGTPAGTVSLLDSPGTFAEVAGRVYIHGGPAPAGIWATDGDAATTGRIFKVPDGSAIQSLTAAAGAVYFSMSMPAGGNALWRSDGTFGTGAPVQDAGGNPVSNPARLTAAGRYLYFLAADAAHGTELWRTDGMPAGTMLLKDIVEGPAGTVIGSMAAAGGLLYFVANDGIHGAELWSTDGTPEGTVMVADLRPGSASSDPQALEFANGSLWFTADDGIAGRELWQLGDGLPVMVADLEPGPGSSSPAEIEEAGALLFFTATTSFGRELWALPFNEGLLSVDDVRITEGTGGTRNLRFTVTRSGSLDGAASVSFTTGGGTATASDYATHTGTLAFADGEAVQFIDVAVQSDSLAEGSESLFITLSSPTDALLGKSVGLGIIDDDDRRAELSIMPVQISETRRYFRIENAGPSAATGVQLRFSESPHPLTLTMTPACLSHTNPLTCGLSPILPGETVFVSVSSTGFGYVPLNAPPGSTVTATVSAAEMDSNPDDNVAANMFTHDGLLMLPATLTTNSVTTAAVKLDSFLTSSQQIGLTMTSSSPNVVITPASVIVPQGQTSASFTLTIGAATGPVRITAKPAGWPASSLEIPVVSPGATAKLDVAMVATTITRVDVGEAATVEVEIAARRHDGTLPTGMVSLLDESLNVIAQQTLDSSAKTVFTKSDLPVGRHELMARYHGDSNFNGLDGPETLVIVDGLRTTLALAAPPIVCLGRTYELEAVVRTPETTGPPTGTVRFIGANGTSPELTLTDYGVPGESRVSWTSTFSSGTMYAEYTPTGSFAATSASKTMSAHSCVAFNLQATAASATSVALSWTPIAGSSRYHVRRYHNGLSWIEVGTVGTDTTRMDTGLTSMRSYLYIVDYYDNSMNYLGSSAPDVATLLLFADDPIVPKTTLVRAQHIEQLRMAANALRWFGLTSDITQITPMPVGSTIRAEHITALRADLNAQRRALGLPMVGFTDPNLAPGTPIKAIHIEELRFAVK